MTTGTITFHAANNNGSFLQAYALQQVLEREYGVQNEIIDFVSGKQERQYSVLRKPQSAGDLGRNAISLLHYKGLKRRNAQFDALRKEYLKTSARVTTEQEVLQQAERYDLAICGSDQIWNGNARDFSPAYFLEGLSTEKITYAVSCGSKFVDGNEADLLRNAKDFSAIAVREPELKAYLEQLGVNDVSVVCDPTLLLEARDYYPLYNPTPVISGAYILLYTINYNDEALRVTQKLAEHLGLPVFAPFTGYSAVKCSKYGIRVLYDVAPDKFLNLMHHATYVVSNSFHGIAFSIIYEKHFFRPGRLNEDGNLLWDDRIDSLLDTLALGDQRVYDNNGLVFSLTLPDFSDRGKTKVALNAMRGQARSYLDKALEGREVI